MKTAGAGAAAAGMAGMAGRDLLGQMFPRGVQAAKKPPVERIPIDSAIIIGGGVAGLTAAYLLTQRGVCTVTVLEACHRPGGRIQTKYYPDGTYACVAYSETYPKSMDPETHWLLGELGLGGLCTAIPDITYYNWRGEYHYQTGSWQGFLNSLPFDDEAGGAAFYETEDVFWYAEKDLVWPLTEGLYPTLDYTDFEDWMLWTEHKKKGTVPHWRSDVSELWDISLRAETGVNSYPVSAAWGHVAGVYWECPSQFLQLKGGNYQIVEELMTKLPAGSVKLGEPVTSVTNLDPTTVQVESNKGTYTADVAIVAVPHNKVASIVPELPSNKVASLAGMGQAKNFIAMQQYSERFWETIHGVKGWGGYSDHGDYGNYPTNQPGAYCVNNETVNQTGTTGIISTYINEPEATPLWDPTKIHGIHAVGSLKECHNGNCDS
ncbi:FAD-dependent oxidoreductase [Candidatus Bathyarchaeota archaeon]|nr:FAD-dependent oxidoreductase [Candidatus Bathyarchaeota archaeon]